MAVVDVEMLCRGPDDLLGSILCRRKPYRLVSGMTLSIRRLLGGIWHEVCLAVVT